MELVGPAAELRADELRSIYELMVLGRTLETRLHTMYRGGRLGGAIYPAVGQEAAQIGFASALDEGDVLGGTHRDLMMQLARGVTLEETLLNFFGKAEAPTKGRDGNSHFGVLEKGTLMVVSPLPDAFPVATGCALAFRQRGEARVAMANCGEGATSTGTFHEAVNMAAVFGLPIVFTIQNNQFAYSTPNEREAALEHFADRGEAYGIPHTVIDGNDVVACYNAAKEAVDRAREGGGPSLIEAVTFRHFGHAGHDPADYVPPEVREEWLARDPIGRFESFLVERGILTDEDVLRLAEELARRVKAAIEWAQGQPDPDPGDVAADVFAVRTTPRLPAPTEPGGDPVTYLEAINRALTEEMEADDRVFVLGEDVGRFGGAFKVTAGLYERFGEDRVIDTPISESAIVGAAVGAALMGRLPVAELQYLDFLYPGLDELVNEAAKYHWKTGHAVPMVLRGPAGAGLRAGPFHSLSPEGLLAHHPGLKVVYPATPTDAKGLFAAALRDPNPVVFLEHKKLYRSVKEPIPQGPYEVPLGSAVVRRSGEDVTIVAWAAMVHVALAAADRLAEEDIAAEVVDLRTIVPLDLDTVYASVRRTSRLLIVQEDHPVASVASELAARVADDLFWDLDAPIRRVTPPMTHIPFAAVLEDAYLPQVDDVVEACRRLAAT